MVYNLWSVSSGGWSSTIVKNLFGLDTEYRKIPKISPRAYIFQRPFLRGLSTEGNLRFKIDWASHIVGSKFTIFALFYFVFESNFPSTSPWGLYLEGRFNGGFFASPVWGAYIWRGLFSEFYGKYKAIDMKMNFYSNTCKTHFHKKGFAS